MVEDNSSCPSRRLYMALRWYPASSIHLINTFNLSPFVRFTEPAQPSLPSSESFLSSGVTS